MKFPFKGNSIENLYYNISSGKYSPIPYIYSEELGKFISLMIVVDVRKKANNDDLIYFPFVKKRIKGFYEDGKKALLIKTIKMPKNIRDINEKLPKGRYEEKEIMKGYDKNNKDNSNNNNGNNYNEKPKIKKIVYNRKNRERYNQNNNYNNNTPEIFSEKDFIYN